MLNLLFVQGLKQDRCYRQMVFQKSQTLFVCTFQKVTDFDSTHLNKIV